MIHDNLEFHNVAELVNIEGEQGVRLQRLPETVRAEIDDGTASCMTSPANSEIRFRLTEDSDSASITLSSEQGATIFIFYGPFQGLSFRIEKEPQEIQIKPHKRLGLLTEAQKEEFDFHPELVRICFGDAYPEIVMYHGNSGNVCPPKESDTPDKMYIAYGSSITHGNRLSGAALSYPAHAAYKLGFDMRNLGASGCCLCEPAMADYLAEQKCDLMTLELSVNMLGRGISAEEFRESAGYLVERIADSDPKRPVVCITIFPHYNDMGENLTGDNEKATSEEYRQVLREIVSDLDRPNLFLIEGPELLSDMSGLFQDLIHPGARGMIQMGEALAKKLEPLVSSEFHLKEYA